MWCSEVDADDVYEALQAMSASLSHVEAAPAPLECSRPVTFTVAPALPETQGLGGGSAGGSGGGSAGGSIGVSSCTAAPMLADPTPKPKRAAPVSPLPASPGLAVVGQAGCPRAAGDDSYSGLFLRSSRAGTTANTASGMSPAAVMPHVREPLLTNLSVIAAATREGTSLPRSPEVPGHLLRAPLERQPGGDQQQQATSTAGTFAPPHPTVGASGSRAAGDRRSIGSLGNSELAWRRTQREGATNYQRLHGRSVRRGASYGASLSRQQAVPPDASDGLRTYLLAVMRAVDEAPRVDPSAFGADMMNAVDGPLGQGRLQRAFLALEAGISVLAEDLQEGCCAVCLDAMTSGQRVATLPCGHAFHANCIRQWLPSSLTCPLCKRAVVA